MLLGFAAPAAAQSVEPNRALPAGSTVLYTGTLDVRIFLVGVDIGANPSPTATFFLGAITRSLGRVTHHPQDNKLALGKRPNVAGLNDYYAKNLLVLQVGGRDFHFSAATYSGSAHRWPDQGIRWSERDRVAVRLAKLVPQAPIVEAMRGAPGDIEVRWEAPANLSSNHVTAALADGYELEVRQVWAGTDFTRRVHRETIDGASGGSTTVHFLEPSSTYKARMRTRRTTGPASTGPWGESATIRTGTASVATLSIEPHPDSGDTVEEGASYNYRVYASDSTQAWSGGSYSGVRTTIKRPGYGSSDSYLSRHLVQVDDDGRVYWEFSRRAPNRSRDGYPFIIQLDTSSRDARVDPNRAEICIPITRNDTVVQPCLAAPGIPQNFTVTPAKGAVVLSWTAPDQGTSPILKYQYILSQAGTSSPLTDIPDSAPGDTNATSYTVTGLQSDTVYSFQLYAVNSVGQSRIAVSDSFRPLALTVPGVPQSLTVTGGNREVALSWTAPTDNGGSPILKYQYIQSQAGTSSPLTDIPDSAPGGTNATSYTVTGLQNNTVYSFQLYAVNRIGQSQIAVSDGVRPQAAESDPLTAAFEAMPETHDGSAFSFRLAFSEAVTATAAAIRDHAFNVTGGAVTAAALVAGETANWTVTVTPDNANGNVTVALSATTDCSADGALCTADNRGLSNALSATVRTSATPFHAQFPRMPDEHGNEPFTFELYLGKPPHRLGYARVRDHLLDVTGGTVTKAKRSTRGESQAWTIHVTPVENADVRIVVRTADTCDEPHAVCTEGGQLLEGDLRDTVYGPAVLSVANASVEESSGDPLEFVVSLSRRRFAQTTVEYATADGTATKLDDYTETSGTLTFAVHETSKTISVQVLNDAINEGDETMTMTLSNPTGARIGNATATGTIENTDPMPKAWLARFGRTAATHVVDALEARLQGGPAQSYVRLGGHRIGSPGADLGETVSRLAPDRNLWEEFDEADPAGRDMTVQELLLSSAFHLVSNPEETGSGSRLSAWGRVATSSFDGTEDEVSLDGTVTTATLGVDGTFDRWLTGLALAYSIGDGSYRMAGVDKGNLESTLTSFHPYVGYALSDRVRLWGMVGYGSGTLRLMRAQELNTDLTLTMGALGMRGTLLEPSQSQGMQLALRSDVLWMRISSAAVSEAATQLVATEADASRLRLVLEASRPVALASGGVVTPVLEIGLRHDGGDAETGAGLEVGGRLGYASSWGLTLEVSVRGLLAHEAKDYEEWGASGLLRFDPGARGRGLSASVMPSWGSASSGVGSLWSRPDTRGLATDGTLASPAGRLDAELGYGLAALQGRGLLTPYARMALVEGSEQALHLGTRLSLAESFNVSLEATRRQREGQIAAHELALLATVPW